MKARESHAALLKALEAMERSLHEKEAESNSAAGRAEIGNRRVQVLELRGRLGAMYVEEAETPASLREAVRSVEASCEEASLARRSVDAEVLLVRLADDVAQRLHGILGSSGSESWGRWPPREWS